MVRDAIEECGGHFGISEYGDPFGEGEVGCDDQRCFFVELADQMEQQCAAGCWEWQIAQLIEDHGVRLDELFGEISGLSLLFFPFQLVHQIDGIIEANALSLMNGGDAQGGCQMSFAGARAAHQDQIMRGLHEGGTGQLLDLGLAQRCFRPVDPGQIAVHGEACGFELIAQAAYLAIGELGFDQAIKPGFRLHRTARALGQQLSPGRRHAIEMQRIELCQTVNE